MWSETLESVAIDMNQKRLAEQLLAQAKEKNKGLEQVGPNGLLNRLTRPARNRSGCRDERAPGL
jgi:putative transposase